MRLVMGAATDVGRVREGNEDAYLVDEAMGLVAVADGMGGHRAGEVASATALEALHAAITGGRPLREAIEDANGAVHGKSLTDPNLRGMGTTLTAGTLTPDGALLVGHVGDSRAYLFHDGELSRLTVDHSLVEELVRDGRLTADEAAVHPQRSIITRALGVDESVEVDVYPVELEPGDRLLICSDGLTGMVQPELIGAELRREDDPARAAADLVDIANAAGGEDNITVVIVAVVDNLPEAEPDLKTEAGVAAQTAEPADVIEATVVEADVIEAGVIDDEPTLGDPEPPASRKRRIGRVAVWVLPILLVIGIAVAAVGWYARHSYYVGVDRGHVTVYKGVPGGLVGWNPTIEQRTALRTSALRPADLVAVRANKHFSSRADAAAFVARIRDHTPATTTTTTPTTTLPGSPTTTTPPTTAPPTTTAPPAGP